MTLRLAHVLARGSSFTLGDETETDVGDADNQSENP